MSRGEAWHFRRLAMSIERADKTSRILDVKYYLLLPSVADVGTPFDTNQWVALLKSVSALEMYRKRHGRTTPDAGGRVPDPRPRLPPRDALLPDPRRGFAAGDHRQHSRAPSARRPSSGWGGCGRNSTTATSRRSSTGGIHEFIDGFQTKLNLVGEAIYETFFALPPCTSRLDQRRQVATVQTHAAVADGRRRVRFRLTLRPSLEGNVPTRTPMPIRVALHHRTSYRYDRYVQPVAAGRCGCGRRRIAARRCSATR